MGSDIQRPPLDGSLSVLPGFVDFHAEHNPDNAWAVFPSAEDPTKKSSISHRQLAGASHRIAHALRPGRAGPEQEVVAILVNCDTILYVVTIIGMFRAGMIVSTISV